MPDDARLRGLRLLRYALAATVVLGIGLTLWTVDKAIENPDVHTRQPRWLGDEGGGALSFWAPLLVTVVAGTGLVFAVFWRAYQRLRAGEDLYAGRSRRRDADG